jgi:hypothetical protein
MAEEPTCQVLGAQVKQTAKGEVIEPRGFSGELVRRVYLYADRATGVQATWRTIPLVTKKPVKPGRGSR